MAALLISLWPGRLRSWARLFDKRGLPVAEAELLGKPGWKRWLIDQMERVNVRRADRIQTVSRRARSHCFDLGAKTPVTVVPNGFGSSLAVAPQASVHPLVVYVGGGQVWQSVDLTLGLMVQIKQSNRAIRCVVSTQDGILKERAAAVGLEAVSLGPDGVAELLDSATVAIVMRSEHPAVLAASPVKLGEALSHGVKVVVTESTWEDHELLVEHGVAYRWSGSHSDVESLCAWILRAHEAGQAGRVRTRNAAGAVLGLDRYHDQLRQFFLGQ
jgi:hypothetical protein